MIRLAEVEKAGAERRITLISALDALPIVIPPKSHWRQAAQSNRCSKRPSYTARMVSMFECECGKQTWAYEPKQARSVDH